MLDTKGLLPVYSVSKKVASVVSGAASKRSLRSLSLPRYTVSTILLRRPARRF